MNTLKHFVIWLDVPVEQAIHRTIQQYIDHLHSRRLKPKTINNNLDSIRGFYNYLRDEEEINMDNPVRKGYVLKLPRPLPRHLRGEEVDMFLSVVKGLRDRAMIMLMLRSGLRVVEVANLTKGALDLRHGQIFILNGKGGKDRVVYTSEDTHDALIKYLEHRRSSKVGKVFLVEKGTYKGKPISVRGIQKRIEYYARKISIQVSCHQLRHTMATQLLNADAKLTTIQDLLGHTRIKTTQRYCKVSNVKVQRDYYKAMDHVLKPRP